MVRESLKYNVWHRCAHASRSNLKLQVKNDGSERSIYSSYQIILEN
jgi:hypothetical protein